MIRQESASTSTKITLIKSKSTAFTFTMKKLFSYIIFLAIFSSYFQLSAQTNTSKLRTGIKLERKLSSKTELNLEAQFRLKNNWSSFDKVLFEPTLKVDLSKKLQSGIVYRYENRQNKKLKMISQHRFGTFIRFKHPIKADWKFKAKSMLQYETQSIWGDYNPENNTWINRNQLSIEYDIFGSPISLETGGELFNLIHTKSYFDRSRLFTGMKYKLSGKSGISIYYLYDNELNGLPQNNAHILMLMYHIKI